MMDNTLTAVIPVRAGSRRLKNKNIRKFAGSNLLIHKIDQLKKVPEIDKIYVSSDSDEMLQMAIDCGVKTHKREPKFADDVSVSFGEVVANVACNVTGENMMWATCTSPLIEPKTYSEAIKKYFEIIDNKQGDSLASFSLIKRHMWDDNGPFNYRLGTEHVVSQDLPNFYIMTFGFSIANRQNMIKWKYLHGADPYKFLLSKRESVDIDDLLDFKEAEAWLDLN